MKAMFSILGCLSFGQLVLAGTIDKGLQSDLYAEAPEIEQYATPSSYHLSWEDSAHPERVQWTQYTFRVLNQYLDALEEANDTDYFCPNYDHLSHDQRLIVWGEIFSGISQYESNWDPIIREPEPTMGKDPVTHLPVYSEGLLQMSYQDIQSNAYCGFDWGKDSKLGVTNPYRTILNPYRNLYCGIRVMSQLTTRNKLIRARRNAYWSTIQPGNQSDRATHIAKSVQQHSFCRSVEKN